MKKLLSHPPGSQATQREHSTLRLRAPVREQARGRSAAPSRKSHRNDPGAPAVANPLDFLILPALPKWKRCMDILIASLAIVSLSPILLFIALFTKIVAPGPVYYSQLRVGRMGRLFTLWKFRTMRVNADAQVHKHHFHALMAAEKPMRKLDDAQDPRIIPFGKILRATGLDELPQLFNVLRGEMSIVGPRPCLPYEAAEYLRWQRSRFDCLPGITGLWQVCGKNSTTFKEMVRLDITYSRNYNLWLDLKILLKTIPAILNQIKDER